MGARGGAGGGAGFSPPADHVDGAAQELLEFLDEVHQVEQRTAALEVDEEVDVAPNVVSAPGERSEDSDTTTSVASGGGDDLVAVLCHDGLQIDLRNVGTGHVDSVPTGPLTIATTPRAGRSPESSLTSSAR
jgi:hypothetical protein